MKPDSREGEYTTNLERTSNYRLSEGRLEIFAVDGGRLVFAPLTEETNLSRTETVWTLKSFVEGSKATPVLAGTEITLTFDGDTLRSAGHVSGSAGCNTYTAGYTYADTLSFEAPATTRRACIGPDGIMEQEQRYLRLLEGVTGYRIIDGRLELTAGGRATLVFTPGK